MSARRCLWLSLGLAALLVASSLFRPALAQEPAKPWLLRLPCRDEAALVRWLAAGMRIVLWWDGQVYALADADQRGRLADEGLWPQALDRAASQGSYYVVWAFPDEAVALEARYGTLVALGDGFYLLGLPPGVELTPGDGPRYAQRLPFSLAAPRPASPALLHPPPPPPMLADVVGAVSQARLTAHVAALQDDDSRPGPDALRSRYTLAPGLDAEAAYVAGELAAAGLGVSYFPFSCGRVVSNVVGTLPGVRPESEGVFILSAHYDSTAAASPGWAQGWPGMPAPGADDNASGTAAVLEAARVLAHRRVAYTVRFCLFAGEEQGLRGSEAYAQALQAAGTNVLAVINLDMIGQDNNYDAAMEVHVGLRSACRALGEVLVRNVERFAPALKPELVTTYAVEASDQAPFWIRGYPAVLAIEDRGQDFNYNYHRVTDRLDVLDMGYCADITRATVATVGQLAQLLAPDLSPSHKEATYDSRLDGSIAYTVTLENQGSIAARSVLTDLLPFELALQGPIAASRGAATWDEAAHRLGWSGDVAPQEAVTLTYRVRLAPRLQGSLLIRSLTYLDDGLGRIRELPAEVRVAWRLVLPLISKGP